jgi:hypothetical protein
MVASTLVDDMSLTDVLLILGIVGVAVKTVMEGKGWTRSSKLLRAENEDLIQRNVTLEKERERERAERLEEERRLTARIAILESKVHELELRDQQAVLNKLDEMEVARRSDHAEAIGVWERIATSLEKGEAS